MSSTACDGQRKKIAIIGAGMAGLCTLRHFAHNPKYSVVAFERMGAIAGVWNYPDQAEKYIDEPNTSPHYCRTYRDLRTNSPRDLTGFQDFPLPKGDDSYCKREVVLRYYHDYVKHFSLSPFIKLRHQVNLVKPVARNASGQVIKWQLEVLELESQIVTTEEFDNVIICNGHYHKPHIPTVNGIENFKGPVLHSSQYRVPEIFQQKTVLVVGARSSAMDIACELIPHAKRVIICRRFQASVFKDKFPNVTETTELADFGANHVILRDGSTVDIDMVILCTGFVYDFPFLSNDCEVHTTRGRVSPLYRHLIHCKNPSMAFVGLANMAAFSHVANAQVFYYKAYLDGKVQLPSTEAMLADEAGEFQEKAAKGVPEHMAHEMTVSQWPYMERLAKETGFPMYEPAIKGMFEANILGIRSMPYGFRNFRVEKVDSENYIRVPLEKQLFGLKPQEKATAENGTNGTA